MISQEIRWLKKQIHTSVDNILKQKGMTVVDGDDADFIVVIHGGSEDRMQIYSSGGIGWYGPWWGPYGDRTDVSYYEEGTLIIDIVDAVKKELTWRGNGLCGRKRSLKCGRYDKVL